MKSKIVKSKISVVLIISLFLTATPFSFAQTAQNDWSAVQKLAAGTDLFIKTSKGKTVKGSLVTVNDLEIELSVKGRSSALPKSNVEAIYFAVSKSGKRGRIIGAIVGAAAGGIAGGAVNSDAEYESDYNYSAPALLLFTGLAGGAFIGSLFGKGRKKGVLIYKAD